MGQIPVNQMKVADLEIFEQTSTYTELRLSDDSGRPLTRGLDRAAADRLAATVEQDYRRGAAGQRMFAAPS